MTGPPIVRLWDLKDWPRRAKRAVADTVKDLCRNRQHLDEFDLAAQLEIARQSAISRTPEAESDYHNRYVAGVHVLADLVELGWQIEYRRGAVVGQRPTAGTGNDERSRRRQAMLARRTEQLREPAVRDFVSRAEQLRFESGHPTSIFSLMRDGRELAAALERVAAPCDLLKVVQPYIQLVAPGTCCERTGLELGEIWRYFRHTWAQPYGSIPGRSTQFLIRDAAHPSHPVIGISALGSAAAQLTDRDNHIGWADEHIVTFLASRRAASRDKWLNSSISACFEEIFTDDLVAEDVVPADVWTARLPDSTLSMLLEMSDALRRSHKLDPAEHSRSDKAASTFDWQERSRKPLFRSKRLKELANLLRANRDLDSLRGLSGDEFLSAVRTNKRAANALSALLRRLRSRSLGTGIADLIVCGAIPPYNELVAGKLVALLSISPDVARYLRERYRHSVSIIASSMAGRPIQRSSDLVYVSTTSLFGVRPCQYDRARIPGARLGCGKDESFGFTMVADTQGFGSMQFGSRTCDALSSAELAEKGARNVHYLFGEGASPRLRGLRDGLSTIGFDATEVMNHEQRRILYGAPLARNTGKYLMGIDSSPSFVLDQRRTCEATEIISLWWAERWAYSRAQRPDVIERTRSHNLVHPIRHGARVVLPPKDAAQLEFFQ